MTLLDRILAPPPGAAGRSSGAVTLFVIVIILAVGVVVPFLNLNVPAGHPLHVNTTTVTLFGKYLTYALLALSVGLIWGYCGILSLGHGAFFALGGYAMGMYLMRQIGSRGVYGNPELPDFMVFLNWKELPWYWHGFDQFWFAAVMVLAVPGLLAFVFGWFAFRSRVTGVYLSIITQALTYALMLAFFRNNFGFGGNNGLTDFKDILGFNVQADSTRATLFAASAVALALGYLICRAVTGSRYGKVLVAVRDAESRTRFLGYRVEHYKLFVFVLSACMAGVAGALYVPQVGIINPSEFEPANSIEAVIWVAVGGRGTLVGPILGGVIVNWVKTIFTGGTQAPYWLIAALLALCLAGLSVRRPRMLLGAAGGAVLAAIGWLVLGDAAPWWPYAVALAAAFGWLLTGGSVYATGALLGALVFALLRTPVATVSLSTYWLFILGGLFIGVTLFLPRGIVGTIAAGWTAWRQRRISAEAEAGIAPIADVAPPGSRLEPGAAE